MWFTSGPWENSSNPLSPAMVKGSSVGHLETDGLVPGGEEGPRRVILHLERGPGGRWAAR